MGKKIKIIKLHQEVHPGQYDLKYSNLEGTILYEGVDSYGELYWMGTWGGVSIFPRIDDYVFI